MDKAKILVVEDDEFLREVYVETLTSEGYNIDIAVDGEEAYQKIKQGGYDLVLLDIILPKNDGLSIMKKIKTEGTMTPNKRLIFLTNLDKDEEIKQALELGDGYLIKSQLTPGDLIKEVEVYLSK
ncbi:MAG: response regulator [Candidatus Levyibacteriota bacterium]|nr:MAG: response regulator [Candidatus Levybacteria bacterium]